jgi:kynureninase
MGEELAVIVLGAVNFFTGQLFAIGKITAAAQKHSASSSGSISPSSRQRAAGAARLNVDFAVWCSYKYPNSGPGAVAGAFPARTPRHEYKTAAPRPAGSVTIEHSFPHAA